MKEMSKRERMLSVYRNQVPDRIPVGIYSRYLPRGTAERELRNTEFGIIEYYPVVSFLGPPWHVYPGFVSEIKGAEMEPRYFWENGRMMERRCYKTPVGEIYQDVGQSKGAGSEHISKYYIAGPEDYKIMQYLVENTVFRKNEGSIVRRKQDLGEEGVLLGRVDRCQYQKLLIELAGAQQFLVDLYTDPDPVLELLDAMDRKMDEAFEVIIESDADVIWQPDNVTSDMTPPSCFEKYCLPFYRKHSKQVKQAGKPYIVHMDGRIKALRDLINSAGFNAIESMSLPEIGGDYTLDEARANFPGLVILPNFPANLCTKGDKEIEEFMVKLLEEAGTETPFMLQVSEDLPEEEWKRVLPLISGCVGDFNIRKEACKALK